MSVGRGYEQLLDSQGLVTASASVPVSVLSRKHARWSLGWGVLDKDVATAAVLNAASDSVAQLSEENHPRNPLSSWRHP